MLSCRATLQIHPATEAEYVLICASPHSSAVLLHGEEVVFELTWAEDAGF